MDSQRVFQPPTRQRRYGLSSHGSYCDIAEGNSGRFFHRSLARFLKELHCVFAISLMGKFLTGIKVLITGKLLSATVGIDLGLCGGN